MKGRKKIDYIKISEGWYWYRDGNGVAIEHRFQRARAPRKNDNPNASPMVEITETQYFSSLLNALKWAADRNSQNAKALADILPRMQRFSDDLEQYFNKV